MLFLGQEHQQMNLYIVTVWVCSLPSYIWNNWFIIEFVWAGGCAPITTSILKHPTAAYTTAVSFTRHRMSPTRDAQLNVHRMNFPTQLTENHCQTGDLPAHETASHGTRELLFSH